MEYLDICDERGKLTGEVIEYKEAHSKGKWHREVSAIIINSKDQVLLQKRSISKRIDPNKWGNTAGHVSHGENFIEAIIKEIHEEIGVLVEEKDIEFLLTEVKQVIGKSGAVNNAFLNRYCVKIDKELCDFKIQEDEVSELKWMNYEEWKTKIINNDEDYTTKYTESIKKVFEILDKKLKKERKN